MSKGVGSCRFIGSPLALRHLFDICHRRNPKTGITTQKPGLQRPLRVIYDVVKAWNSYINKDIQYFNVPHAFVHFRSSLGVAVMQWKYVSTDSEWLPRRPQLEDLTTEQALAKSITGVSLNNFAIANDKSDFYRLLNVQESTITRPLSTVDVISAACSKRNAAIARMTDEFQTLALRSIDQQTKRYDAQLIHGTYGTDQRFQSTPRELAALQQYMHDHSPGDEGFIMWINEISAEENGLPPLESIVPSVCRLDDAKAWLSYEIGSESSDTVSKARYISSVASRILGTKTIAQSENKTYSYKAKELAEDEVEYYQSLETDESVLLNFVEDMENEIATYPYELFPVSHIQAQEIKTKIDQNRAVVLKDLQDKLNSVMKDRYVNFERINFKKTVSREMHRAQGRGRGRGRGRNRIDDTNKEDQERGSEGVSGSSRGRGRGHGRGRGRGVSNAAQQLVVEQLDSGVRVL